MKRIPEKYWYENYGSNIPSPLQRAWVQRWFELLDSNTSYLFSLHAVNFPLILEDLLNLSDKARGSRTYSRFAIELNYCFSVRREEDVIRECLGATKWNRIKHIVDSLCLEADTLFEQTGYERPSVEHGNHRRHRFKETMESLVTGEDPEFRDLFEQLRRDSLSIISQTKSYRHCLQKLVFTRLLDNSETSDWHDEFGSLDLLTQALVTDLVVQDGYSFLYLTNLCKKCFLRTNNRMPFEERAARFFQRLQLPDSQGNSPKFTVYLRVQAKRIIQTLSQFAGVLFSETADEEVKAIISLQKRLETWSNEQVERAAHFFYLNYGSTPELTFAIVPDLRARDSYSAAASALEIITKAIQQAKFEYELGAFNVDNRMYVYNQQTHEMTSITRKQLAPARYGIVGDERRLENFLTKLALANRIYPHDDSNERKFIAKLRDVTLGWHKLALESGTKETRFLDHWIGLEQLFTSIEDIELNRQQTVKSPADKLVLCFNQILNWQWKIQILNDLWGDVLRSKILGVRRVIAPKNGIIEEVLDSTSDNADLGTSGKNKHYYVRLRTQHGGITIRVMSDASLLVTPGAEVEESTWLASANYNHLPFENVALQCLFADSMPTMENLLFVAVYGDRMRVEEARIFYDSEIAAVFAKLPRKLIEISRLYDAAEAVVVDLAGIAPWFADYYPDSELRLLRENVLNPEHISVFLENLKTIAERVDREYRGQNNSINAVTGRIQPLLFKLPDMKDFFYLYKTLHDTWLTVVDEYCETEVRNGEHYPFRLMLPSALICELFHRQTPHIDRLERLLLEKTEGFLELCASQPLLEYRVFEIERVLSSVGPYLPYLPLYYFVADLDRMRRTRHSLVHQGRASKSLELLTQRLYKYSRVCLRELTHSLVHDEARLLNPLTYK